MPVTALTAVAAGVQYGFARGGSPSRVTTETLTMTGKADQPRQIYTETLTMTGQSFQPLQIVTDTLTMTGKH